MHGQAVCSDTHPLKYLSIRQSIYQDCQPNGLDLRYYPGYLTITSRFKRFLLALYYCDGLDELKPFSKISMRSSKRCMQMVVWSCSFSV